MNVTETQTQTAFEPLRCHSLIVPWTIFLTGKNKTNIKPCPFTDPQPAFRKTKKNKTKNKIKTLRLTRGAPSSLLTRPFYIQHCALCQSLVGRFANGNKNSWSLPPALGDSPPVSPTHYGCLILHKVTVDGGAAGSRRRKQERTASSWPQSIPGLFFSSSSRGDGSRKSFLRPRHNKAARVQSAPMKSRCIFAVEEIEIERKAKKKKKTKKLDQDARSYFLEVLGCSPSIWSPSLNWDSANFFFFSQWPDIVSPPP